MYLQQSVFQRCQPYQTSKQHRKIKMWRQAKLSKKSSHLVKFKNTQAYKDKSGEKTQDKQALHPLLFTCRVVSSIMFWLFTVNVCATYDPEASIAENNEKNLPFSSCYALGVNKVPFVVYFNDDNMMTKMPCYTNSFVHFWCKTLCPTFHTKLIQYHIISISLYKSLISFYCENVKLPKGTPYSIFPV